MRVSSVRKGWMVTGWCCRVSAVCGMGEGGGREGGDVQGWSFTSAASKALAAFCWKSLLFVLCSVEPESDQPYSEGTTLWRGRSGVRGGVWKGLTSATWTLAWAKSVSLKMAAASVLVPLVPVGAGVVCWASASSFSMLHSGERAFSLAGRSAKRLQ